MQCNGISMKNPAEHAITLFCVTNKEDIKSNYVIGMKYDAFIKLDFKGCEMKSWPLMNLLGLLFTGHLSQ